MAFYLAAQIEQDRYVTMIRTAPPQLQAAMAAVIQATGASDGHPLSSGCAYDAYKAFCGKAGIRTHTARAFGDLLTELDMYSFVRCNVLSRGRYGRTRQITLELPEELSGKIQDTILLNFELR